MRSPLCDPLLMFDRLIIKDGCHTLECSAQCLIISLQSIDVHLRLIQFRLEFSIFARVGTANELHVIQPLIIPGSALNGRTRFANAICLLLFVPSRSTVQDRS
jgi:hypothetical protein